MAGPEVGHLHPPRASSRAKAVSQSSGCYDSDSAEPCPTDDTADGHPYAARDGGRGSGLRRQAIQNWHRRPYRNSTEGEEGDVSDVGSRTTESEAEGWDPEVPGIAASRHPGSCRLTGETALGGSRMGRERGGGRGCHHRGAWRFWVASFLSPVSKRSIPSPACWRR